MKIRTLAMAAAFALAGAAPVFAGDILGNWQRADGSSRIRMSECGDAVCGHITWLRDKDSPAHVGQRVFYNMKDSGGGAYAGSAFNPEDGKTYSGKATVSGSSMTTKGCVLGGLICKSVSWRRM
ncbi:MAG: DUF2147 domain-containing protein [Hyphomicrobiales bacterium]|nr:DUF2147 domain-containing protein [Hyphomicrobiales bacterium]